MNTVWQNADFVNLMPRQMVHMFTTTF